MIKKYLFYLTLMFMLISIIISISMYRAYYQNKEDISNNVENTLSIEAQRLTFSLNEVRTDLNYLSNKFSSHNNIDMEKDFLNFSSQKKRYSQLRYLDNFGMEKVRVDYKNHSIIIPKSNLQNKKNRYYFSESIDLNRSNIYISPLDLNVEHNIVQVPIKPTIRFATPVYNTKNEKMGVIIINYLADEIVGRLKNIRNGFFGKLYFLNSDGYYFVGKDSSREWGFMFKNKKNITFKDEFQDVWRYINSKNIGTYENNKGIYFFKTIDLLNLFDGTNKIVCDDSKWRLVLFVPHSYIEDKVSNDFVSNFLIYIVISIILAIFLWIVLANVKRKDENEKKIEDLNKQIINERDSFVAGPTIVFRLKYAYGWPVEYVSKNVKDILGYDVEEFVSGNLVYANIILPKYIEKFSERLADAKKNDEQWLEHEPYEVVTKYGKRIWLRNSIHLVKDGNGNVTHLYGYIVDITDLKNAQKKLEDNNRYIKTIIDTIADPTVVIDVKTFEVLLYNKAAKDLYLSKEKIPSSITCYKLSHSRDEPCNNVNEVCPITQILLTKSKTKVTHKHYKEDGSVIYVELIAIPIFDKKNNVTQIIESHRDISHHLETETALKELAATDKLTQAYNRVKFDEILEKSFILAKENDKHFGLIMLDIDHFKKINDKYGHNIGDSVLVEITEVVKKLIRKNDILVRWGGEEFIVFIPECTISVLKHISENLRYSIENHEFKHINYPVTSSFGATILKAEDTIESLLTRVDNALYESKDKGRNTSTIY